MGKKKNKKRSRIIWRSVLSVLLVIAIGANIALYHFSDVISAYFSTIDMDSKEAVAARESSTKLAEKISDEGVVLLQNNDNTLPIQTSKENKTKVNVFGWSFTNPIYGGTGSGASDASTAVTPKAGLEAAGFEVNDELYNDYVSTRSERPLVGMDGQDWTIPEPDPKEFYTNERMKQAKDFSDTAIIFIARSGGEGADLPTSLDGKDTFDPKGGPFGASGVRYGNKDDLDASKHYLELSNREKGMIEAVTKNFDNVVLVVNSNNTFELGWLKDYKQIKSVINIAGPGQNGFASLGKVLSGQVNPSGRTVDIYTADLMKNPAMSSFGDQYYVVENGDNSYSIATDKQKVNLNYVDYKEGVYLGYRFYETAAQEGAINYDEEVVYPFGYGLSYTEFSQEVVPNSLVWDDENISVEVKVTNTGSLEGKEVVQLYYSAPYTGKIEKPSEVLAAFAKTGEIKPGESETVKLSFKVEDMASYDSNKVFTSNGGYVLEAGKYNLMIMKDSHEKIADVASKELTQVVYDKDGRSSDKQVAVNQLDNELTGDGSLTTVLSRADGFANLDKVITQDKSYTVKDADGKTKTVTGKLIKSDFVNFINGKRYDIPEDTHEKAPVTGADNGKVLKEYAGVDYNDESWDKLLDQLTVDDLMNITTLGGYRTVEIESVGKPATLDYDGPAAINNMNMAANGQSGIAFPAEVMLASTWNVELAKQMGESIGAEAQAYGVTGWYAPAMNIHRTAFSGRNFEYYSEDGYLSGVMAAAVTKGYQSTGGYVYMKHYALNDQETNRNNGVLTWADEQTVREIYLKPFEIAVKEGGANAVMSSFNSIGNTWAGASSALLKEILRNEWGFTGLVETDFYMINAYPYMDFELGVRNGNDLYLTGAAPVGVPEVNKDSKDTLWAMRDAAHNILYTVANSSAIDSPMSSETPTWIKITIGVDVLVAFGIGIGFFLTFRKSKKKGEVEAA
ncbi:glycoside hydrolase family 3 N-terminal domain-containing protein [Bacillus andreraoultii]|uniref:glycoside hydrolase family 3 N-terminal domain-containing protein n=1 Tax=Bacillus andreraoultii TaxID=1499685 RepID=UPI00067ED4D3|nr:glycoside hydrolase family 3 N-terminal domain-containing protein [Bacillus andreraoultii]